MANLFVERRMPGAMVVLEDLLRDFGAGLMTVHHVGQKARRKNAVIWRV